MKKYEQKLHQELMLNKLTENARKTFENPLHKLLKDERLHFNNALSVAESMRNCNVSPRICNTAQDVIRFNNALSVAESMRNCNVSSRICNTAQDAMRFNNALSIAGTMKSNHNLDGIQKMIQNAMTVNSADSVAEAMRCCSEIKRSMMGIGAWRS